MSRKFLYSSGEKVLISVFLRKDLLDRFRKLAKEQGLTVSSLLEILIRDFYKQYGDKLHPAEYTQTSLTITKEAKEMLDEMARRANDTAQAIIRAIMEEAVRKKGELPY